MATKAIRKVFELGEGHPRQRFSTLPRAWLRWLEQDRYIVPQRVTFEMMKKSLIIKPFVGETVAELAGRAYKKVMTIGVVATIVELPRSWCLMCDNDLGRPLQWVWMRTAEDSVILEPASHEEHDERANYYRRRPSANE